MKKSLTVVVVIVVLLGILLWKAAYTIPENEQVVITQFGKVVKTVPGAGLHIKIPFMQEARRFEKRWLEWDGDPNQITTRDKRYIAIDVFARWRISNLDVFIEKLQNETRAQSRLDDIIDSATRNVVANHNLIEVIRTTNRRFAASDQEVKEIDEGAGSALANKILADAKAKADEAILPVNADGEPVEGAVEGTVEGVAAVEPTVEPALEPAVVAPQDKEPSKTTEQVNAEKDNAAVQDEYTISVGRAKLTRLILKKASVEAAKLGIELKDVQFKRIDYIGSVQQKVFERMISERQLVAESYRSEGQGLKAEIEGRMERELAAIESVARRNAMIIRGQADAEAARIFADSYKKDPEFYEFMKTLDTYKATVDKDTMILLTTESDYARLLSDMK